MTLDEAQRTLSPHLSVFAPPVEAAVQSWHGFVQREPALAAAFDATARANAIHCWIKSEVRSALEESQVARETSALGFFAVAIGTAPVVRFKLTSSGYPSNVRTEQQQNLASQAYNEQAMEALADEGIFSPPTLLTCGYKLDLAAQLTEVEIRLDYKQACLWAWTVWGDEEGHSAEQVAFPGGPEPQPAVIRSTRTDAAKGEQAGSAESSGA